MSLPEHKLTVQAADPTTEITIYDGSFNRLGRGVGRYEAMHPDGLYQIRVRTAGAQEEKLISLVRDETITIGPVSFSSAVPLTFTATTDAAHERAVIRAGAAPVIRGTGSGLLIVVRDRPARESDARGSKSPGTGLSLRNSAGKLIFDVGQDAPVDWSGSSPVAAVYLHVDPGLYRLRIDPGNGSARERPLVASSNLSTQCFLVCRSHPEGTMADLDRGAVSLGRIDTPFAPDDRLTRLGEAARDALANNRKVTGAVTRELMKEKFQDPMLGLFVGHLLLRDRDYDDNPSPVLAQVVDNLFQLLGRGHPDVQALALATSHPAKPVVVKDLPMLRASWDAIVTCTVVQPLLVPLGSPAASLSTQVRPSFPWLVWDAQDTKATRVDAKMAALRSYVHRTPAPEAALGSLALESFAGIGFTAPNRYRPRAGWKATLDRWAQFPSGAVGSWQADISIYWRWITKEGKVPRAAWADLKMSSNNAETSLYPNSTDRGLIPPELFSRVLARSQANEINPDDDIADVIIDPEPETIPLQLPQPAVSLDTSDRQELARGLGVPASVLDDMLSKIRQ